MDGGVELVVAVTLLEQGTFFKIIPKLIGVEFVNALIQDLALVFLYSIRHISH